MKKTNNSNIYLDTLNHSLKFAIFSIVFCIILFCGFSFIFANKENAQKNGEKVIAKIVDIDESADNPLHNPYHENRKIYSMEIQYTYKGKTYLKNINDSYNIARIGDTFDLYILNNDPDNTVAIFDNDNVFIKYLILIFIIFIILVFIFNFIITIKEFLLYKRALSKFTIINSNFVKVDYNRYYLSKKYFIYCTSDEIDGRDRTFKSHPFNYDPSEAIKKHNITKFDIYYNKNNIKKYIINTNKLDKFVI